MTWKTLGLISLLSPAAVRVHSHGASRAEQWTARLGPGSVPAPHSSVPFSARPAWRSEKRFGLVFFSYWSEISETIASALSLVRSEAQQRGRNLVLAIHTNPKPDPNLSAAIDNKQVRGCGP